MNKRPMNICVALIALALAGVAMGQTATGPTDPSNPGQPPISPGPINGSNPGQPPISPGPIDPSNPGQPPIFPPPIDATNPTPPVGTIPALPPGQTHVASKFAAPFVTLAGSRENAVALATALRTGSTATLTYTSIAQDPANPAMRTTTIVTITPPTKTDGLGQRLAFVGAGAVRAQSGGHLQSRRRPAAGGIAR